MILRKKMRVFKNQKGMTLIELMAVVVILGILAAVAGSAVVSGFSKATTNADRTSETVLMDAAQRYIMDNNVTISDTATTITVTQLLAGAYLKEAPKTAAGKTYVNLTVKYTSASDKTLVWTYSAP